MKKYKIKKGLNIPVSNFPEQIVQGDIEGSFCALLGDEYPGLMPDIMVEPGQNVKAGELLFTDKKNPGVKFVSLWSGTVRGVYRGKKRRLKSLVVERSGDDFVSFDTFTASDIKNISEDAVREHLIESGFWTTLRTRPFSRVPKIDDVPEAVFITLTDTRPLAPSPAAVIKDRVEDLINGAEFLSKLAKVYICKAPDVEIGDINSDNIEVVEFSGPHPAGLAGTHVHFLHTVDRDKLVFTVDYQNVLNLGTFLKSGRMVCEKIISLAGPGVKEPCLIKTEAGVCTDEISEGRLTEEHNRIISGSLLYGRKARSDENYLGRMDNQITVLNEGHHRDFLGWAMPGFKRYSAINIFMSKFIGKSRYDIDTNTNGSLRAIMPVGIYDKVMPLDIIPVPLLKALLTKDIEAAENLGCVELSEEDLSLMTFVCPGKNNYAGALREVLDEIEKEL